MINKIEAKLTELKNNIISTEGKVSLLSTQLDNAQIKLAEIDVNRDIYKKAVEVLDIAQQNVRKLIKDGFEGVVTNALQTVFGEEFGFELEFGRRGNLQEVDFKVINSSLQNSHDPQNVTAGGEIDVIALALKVVILELYQKVNKSPFISDEPFKFVSPDYVELAGGFLQVLNEKMRRQVIMVTHKRSLLEMADNIIEVENITDSKSERKLLIDKQFDYEKEGK